jgi:AraC-like DNA-binding protein/quercetin dioxygenase-like cupin family protein
VGPVAAGGVLPAPARESVTFSALPGQQGIVRLAVDHGERKWNMFHETFTVASILSGQGKWTYRRREREIRPGGLMLIEPGEVHVTNRIEGDACFRVLFIDPRLVEARAASLGHDTGRIHLSEMDTFEGGRVGSFEALHRAAEEDDALAVSELLAEGLWRLFRGSTERARSLDDQPLAPKRLREIRARVHAAFEDDPSGKFISVEQIASDAEMNSVQMIRTWRRYWGCPVWVYVTRLRLARARRLILARPQDGLRTLADVAVAAGYADLPHMDKAFMKQMGVTPRAFARQTCGEAWSAGTAGRRRGHG